MGFYILNENATSILAMLGSSLFFQGSRVRVESATSQIKFPGIRG